MCMPYMLYTQLQHSFTLQLEGIPGVKGGLELMVVDFALKTRRGGGAGSAEER